MLKFATAFGAVVLSAMLLFAVGPVGASTPATSSVTVPSTVGQTVTDTWTGALPPGTNATSDCSPFVDNSTLADQHSVTVNVPAGAYNAVQANFTFNITWPDASNDEILTVIDPDGNEVGSSDTGQPS